MSAPAILAEIPALEIRALSHRYADVAGRMALDQVNLTIRSGEFVALLGPNGGGKSTLFKILSTLLRPSAGTASIFGREIGADPDGVRALLGVVFQAPALDRKLTAYENLWHHGLLFGLTGQALKTEAQRRLEQLGVADRADSRVETLSGGLQRRVEIAKGLISSPRLLLLDEPATGLDPGARRDLANLLESLRKTQGLTIFLTTHFMDEAEKADRVALLHEGHLLAFDTPAALKEKVGGDVITLHCAAPELAAEKIKTTLGLDAAVSDGASEGAVRIEVRGAAEWVPKLFELLPGRITRLEMGQPTLEDVFLKLTGHHLAAETQGKDAAASPAQGNS